MLRRHSGLPGWEFTIEEVSANVYHIVGIDARGHSVSRTGTDVDEILNACVNDALAVEQAAGIDRIATDGPHEPARRRDEREENR
jgi:pimeloyl-ACP methyl ester carboxylesterase